MPPSRLTRFCRLLCPGLLQLPGLGEQSSDEEMCWALHVFCELVEPDFLGGICPDGLSSFLACVTLQDFCAAGTVVPVCDFPVRGGAWSALYERVFYVYYCFYLAGRTLRRSLYEELVQFLGLTYVLMMTLRDSEALDTTETLIDAIGNYASVVHNSGYRFYFPCDQPGHLLLPVLP